MLNNTLPNSLNITSPKRSRKAKSTWEDCFPYYAGFTDTFVRAIIESSSISPNSLILDPWNGSGTTTYAASQLGYSSLGYDLNPVMVLIARARALSPTEADSLEPQARSLCRNLQRLSERAFSHDPLFIWFDSETVKHLRGLERRIRSRLTSTRQRTYQRSSSKSRASLRHFTLHSSQFAADLRKLCVPAIQRGFANHARIKKRSVSLTRR